MTVNSNYPELDRERIAVIDNIAMALEDGDTFRKVEPHDPVVTDEDRKRVIIPFDLERKKAVNKIRTSVALSIARGQQKRFAPLIELVGLENALSVAGGAIVTSNHYSPTDSLPVRIMAVKCGREKSLYTVIEESNALMTGYFGFLLRNCNTLPLSASASYMGRRFKPVMKNLLGRGAFVLVYPEEQMWFNYRKPRELRDGAYYFAAEGQVPVIPCFTELRDTEGFDPQGFRNIKRVLHIMPPIYPDPTLSRRENAAMLKEQDRQAKLECYKRAYGEYPSEDFVAARDIAGYWV